MKGGYRPGSGAKAKPPLLKKYPVGIKLSGYVLDVLRDQSNQSALIEQLLIRELKIKAPEQ